ncbi:MAG: hypothetical protein Q8P95_02670 [bacterium]|nr:hypothetical protein [bacterium]
MIRFFFISLVAVSLLAQSVAPAALAAKVSITLDNVCCVKKYPVYGEKSLPASGECKIQAEVQPLFTNEEIKKEAEELKKKSEQQEKDKEKHLEILKQREEARKEEEAAVAAKDVAKLAALSKVDLAAISPALRAELDAAVAGGDVSKVRVVMVRIRVQVRSDEKDNEEEYSTAGAIALGIPLAPIALVIGTPVVIIISFVEGFISAKDGLLNLFQSEDDPIPFFVQHSLVYHDFMDKLFSEAIKKLASYQTAAELGDALKNEFKAQCTVNNPRPDCVIERAMCSYEKYGQVLFHTGGGPLVDAASSSGDINQLLVALQKRNTALTEEAQHTQEALDTAISVYNQYYQTYQLHLQLSELIQRLATIKNWTLHMKDLVSCFPEKFVGVATTKCN